MGNEQALLNFIQEPIFLLSPQGAILATNAAGESLIGQDAVGRDIATYLASPPDDFIRWLKLCSGTTAPLVGGLILRTVNGNEKRLRTSGARLARTQGPTRIAVRCIDVKADTFSLLKKEVDQLNTEARERQHRQAMLEEALRNNEVLLRELNHRVKNNIQFTVGLFSTAVRETESEEVKKVLRAATSRLLAIGAAQDLMYQSQQVTSVPAARFMHELVEIVSRSLGPNIELDVHAVDGKLSNEIAFPLALIVNELVTNSAKYGVTNGRGSIQIRLDREGDEFALTVHDNGPGIVNEGPQRRSSGLGLIRGLCRQIGAEFLIENDQGARSIVRFTNKQLEKGE